MNVISGTFSYLDKLPVFLQLAATFYSDVCLVARTPSPKSHSGQSPPYFFGAVPHSYPRDRLPRYHR